MVTSISREVGFHWQMVILNTRDQPSNEGEEENLDSPTGTTVFFFF